MRDVPETPSAFVWTPTHTVARERFEFAVRSRAPVILLIGSTGVGKTSLVDQVIDNRMPDLSVAVFTDPAPVDADPRGAIRQAIMQLRTRGEPDGSKLPVLVIDDAHRLLQTTIAILIEVARSEAEDGPLLKLVFVAKPGFDEVFHRILPNTVALTVTLDNLSDEEASDFIRARQSEIGVSAHLDAAAEARLLKRAKGNVGLLVRSLDGRRRVPETTSQKEPPARVSRPPAASGPSEDIEFKSRRSEPYVPPLQLQPDADSRAPARRKGRARLVVYALIVLFAGGLVYREATDLFAVPAPAISTGMESPLPLELPIDAGPEQLFRAAIKASVEDARMGIVLYSLAALDGHARAAYFLGQMYDGGEALAPSPPLAVAWYSTAAETIPRASLRIEAIRAREASQAGDGVPEILFASLLKNGDLHLVWNDTGAPMGARYAVEFADRSGSLVESVAATVPATSFRPHPSATRFRVSEISGDVDRAGEWMALPN